MMKLIVKFVLFLLSFTVVTQANLSPLTSPYNLRSYNDGARYYDPRTSVWQSPDPIIGEYMSGETNNGVFNPKNLQLFTYTYNNPINLVDPNGLETVGEILTNWSQEVVRNDVANDRSGLLGFGAVLAESEWNTFGPEAVSKVADNAWNGRDDMTGSDYAWAGFEVATAGVVGAVSKLFKGANKASDSVRYSPINPGPLDEAVATTFRGASYTETTLKESTTLYRAYGGSAGKIGSYWTKTKPSGPLQTQLDSALAPQWGNTAQNIVSMRVPKGTKIYEGFAAPQSTGVGQILGGGNQVYIPRVDPKWIK